MNEIQLLKSTGNPKVDEVLRGGIGIFEIVFENRIRGYYLVGSLADGTAVSSSDIDMKIVFKDRFRDETEKKKAERICYDCFGRVSPFANDVTARDEETVFGSSSLRQRIKVGSLLIYGEDIRDQLALPEIDEHIWDTMFRAASFCFAKRIRPNLKFDVFPLTYPDESDEFYGYTYQQGTAVFHSVVCAIATAIVASQAKVYVFTKSDCLPLYKQHINDEWTPLLRDVYEVCRGQWEYRIPEPEADQQLLRSLCRQTPTYENHFLELYRDYLLQELKQEAGNRKVQAAKRLGEIIYPDAEVVAALQFFESHHSDELRRVVQETLKKIHRARCLTSRCS